MVDAVQGVQSGAQKPRGNFQLFHQKNRNRVLKSKVMVNVYINMLQVSYTKLQGFIGREDQKYGNNATEQWS